ncbi:hypothetical protein EBQ34_10730 [Vandammella animalimorsus]|uniref:Uncharacterized protein n=1 Tax=Vandammella animalimorsus TaxID=2029117 RepID=A0A3M6R8Z2_9BURK|nr:hypothetical protein [Vandammella animalimorsus]RMX11320.1 hypothetical protein EBQ34_10730 [Vandammella animalimorsus]
MKRARKPKRATAPDWTPQAIGLAEEKYQAALRYLFDRPVPARRGQEWYWNWDATQAPFDATPLEWTRIQTVLFANAGRDLAPYSDEQIGMGLHHVMSNDAGDIPLAAIDPSVPLADAMRMMQAFPKLWQDCIGPRLAHVRTAIGHEPGRLGFVCYMWFDVWPTFHLARQRFENLSAVSAREGKKRVGMGCKAQNAAGPGGPARLCNAADRPNPIHCPPCRDRGQVLLWRDAMWRALSAMLDVPCRAVQIAALHGLGHEGEHLQREREIHARIERFIQSLRGQDQELADYAYAARQGMVQ